MKMNRNTKNIALTILFAIAVLLTIWQIMIYRKTVIDFQVPFVIWLTTGLVFTPFMTKALDNYYSTKHLLLQLLFNSTTFGGIIVFLFMSTNFYFHTGQVKKVECEIINTGTLGRGRHGTCKSPFATVVINKVQKQLVFGCGIYIHKYKNIELELVQGRWGYDIISRMNPKNHDANG